MGSSSSREEIIEVVDAPNAAMAARVLSFDVLTTPERLRILECLEQVARQVPVPGHALINQLGEQADETELGGRLARALADRSAGGRSRRPW